MFSHGLSDGREEGRIRRGRFVRREEDSVQQSCGSDWQVNSYTNIGYKDRVMTEHWRKISLLGTLTYRQGRKNLVVSVEGDIGRKKEGWHQGLDYQNSDGEISDLRESGVVCNNKLDSMVVVGPLTVVRPYSFPIFCPTSGQVDKELWQNVEPQ